VIPFLIDAAEKARGEAKAAVLQALAALKAPRPPRQRVKRSPSDPDQRVRRWAALLLWEVGAKVALPELQQALEEIEPQ
jgi:HEAT repeat protein